MKKICVVVFIGVVVFVVIGCFLGGGGGEGVVEGIGFIDVWFFNNEQEVVWGQVVVEVWNVDYFDEKVIVQEIFVGLFFEEVIMVVIMVGIVLCLVYNVVFVVVLGWVKQGGFVDFSMIEGGSDYIMECGGEVDVYVIDGKFYQLFWKLNLVMVMYNKVLFEVVGIDLDDLQMNMYDVFFEGFWKIVEFGVQSVIWFVLMSEFYQLWFDFYLLYFVEIDGMMLVEDGKVMVDLDDGCMVLEFWCIFYEEKLVLNEVVIDDVMFVGIMVMQLVGLWVIFLYVEIVDVGFMFVLMSDGCEDLIIFVDLKSVLMFIVCENQVIVWEFLKFFMSVDSDGQFLEVMGQMLMCIGFIDVYVDYFFVNFDYVVFVEQVEWMVDVFSILNFVEVWQVFCDEYFLVVIFGKELIDDYLKNVVLKIDDFVVE